MEVCDNLYIGYHCTSFFTLYILYYVKMALDPNYPVRQVTIYDCSIPLNICHFNVVIIYFPVE